MCFNAVSLDLFIKAQLIQIVHSFFLVFNFGIMLKGTMNSFPRRSIFNTIFFRKFPRMWSQKVNEQVSLREAGGVVNISGHH